MHSGKTQLFLQSPNFETLTLTIDSSHPRTLHNLKLSLLADRGHSLSSFYFTLDGKPLSDSTQIPNPRITPLSTLVLSCRLSGGGGDGGATGAESRDCYLNMYAEKKPDKVDPNEQRLSKWLNCALSNDPLTEPCVIDRLGNLFNKEALVEALLEKKLPKEFGHIRGLKDMISINLSPIPGEGSTRSDTRFQCPITGLEFNGKYKFFALRNCGHVFSAKALKEIKSSSCLVCHEEFKESDRMVINGSDEEVAALRERIEEERAKTRDKKTKKRSNGNVVGVTGEEVDLVVHSSQVNGGTSRIDDKVKVSGKVEVNGKVENGGVAAKGASNGTVVRKRFRASDMAPPNANKEVYASIFTSSRKSEFKETYSCRSLPLGRN